MAAALTVLLPGLFQESVADYGASIVRRDRCLKNRWIV
jgi:hypothetical protein